MQSENTFTHNQQFLVLSRWDFHNHHGLPSKSFYVIGRIIHKQDIKARLNWRLFSHSELPQGKLLRASKNVFLLQKTPFSHSENSFRLMKKPGEVFLDWNSYQLVSSHQYNSGMALLMLPSSRLTSDWDPGTTTSRKASELTVPGRYK